MRTVLGLIVSFFLIGCEAQATPIASISTPTSPPQATVPPVQVLRYGVAPNLEPYLGDDLPVAYDMLDSNSPITDYDLVVAYGIYDGWQQSPISHRVSLAINPNLAPLDDSIFRNLIPSVLDSQVIVDNLNIPNAQQTTIQDASLSSADIRTFLANNGYPDGFELVMASENVPALELLLAQFSDLFLDVRVLDIQDTVISDNRVHLVLFLWADDSERAFWGDQVGEDNILDLWTMPISYISQTDLPVEFTDMGIPIFSQ